MDIAITGTPDEVTHAINAMHEVFTAVSIGTVEHDGGLVTLTLTAEPGTGRTARNIVATSGNTGSIVQAETITGGLNVQTER